MQNKKNKISKMLLPALLTILFCIISTVSLLTIVQLQGHARVVNYTGIVRGATQRLVKQEMHQLPNDELIEYLDGIIDNLMTGKGKYDLIVLSDKKYQKYLNEIYESWDGIKNQIDIVRNGGSKDSLFELSEKYFEKANLMVSAAEDYSEKLVRNAVVILLCLNAGFVCFAIWFFIYQQRQKKVEAALSLAENASKAKGEFLSMMSHEIRTPINGIIGMNTIARMSVDNREQLLDCLKKIDLSAEYLLSLINDILDMSRIESGKIELEQEEFSLKEMLDRICAMFNQKAENSGVKFSVYCKDLTVDAILGDNLRISQVIINLISNALKFTPAGGQVSLTVRQTDVSSENVSLEIEIADTGIGVSEEFQSRIFEPFEQAQAATTRQYGGTGLGLSISSNFVKMMGGDISIQSKLNEGTKFTITLTLPRPAKAESVSQKIESEQAVVDRETELIDIKDAKVLLAEDNEINSEIVTVILENSGASVDRAVNGRDALDKFAASKEGTYNLILMDIQMPVMNGLESTSSIRSLNHPDAKKVIIIGLSANAFREDIEKAMESGMNGYLPKPIDMNRLLDTIRRYLK